MFVIHVLIVLGTIICIDTDYNIMNDVEKNSTFCCVR